LIHKWNFPEGGFGEINRDKYKKSIWGTAVNRLFENFTKRFNAPLKISCNKNTNLLEPLVQVVKKLLLASDERMPLYALSDSIFEVSSREPAVNLSELSSAKRS